MRQIRKFEMVPDTDNGNDNQGDMKVFESLVPRVTEYTGSLDTDSNKRASPLPLLVILMGHVGSQCLQ